MKTMEIALKRNEWYLQQGKYRKKVKFPLKVPKTVYIIPYFPFK